MTPLTNAAAALVPPGSVVWPSGVRPRRRPPGARTPRAPADRDRFVSDKGAPRWSQAPTGITHGFRISVELPIAAWLPLAATTRTPCRAARCKAASSSASSCTDGREAAALTLMMRAPAVTQSRMARASSPAGAVGPSAPAGASRKTGRTRRVQSGQIPGGAWAHKSPAMNVPCPQAALPGRVQPEGGPMPWRREPAKAGWSVATGPSTRPTATAGSPRVWALSDPSPTRSRASAISVDKGDTPHGETRLPVATAGLLPDHQMRPSQRSLRRRRLARHAEAKHGV